MKLIKLAIISVVFLFLVILGISLLMPSTVRVSRAIVIDAPLEKVYPLTSQLPQWPSWNKYVDSIKGIRSITATELIGEDMSILITSANDSLVAAQWQPKTSKAFTSGYRLLPHEEVTTVQWYFDFKIDWYPWEKFGSIIYDQQMGPVMEQSLSTLKSIAEGVPNTDLPAGHQ